MGLSIDPSTLVSFLLVLTRTLAVFLVAPPFAGLFVPTRVRLALATAIALAVAPTQHLDVALGTLPLVASLVYQVAVGGLFGYVVLLLLSAPMVAGSLIDHLSGFSAASVFDPFAASVATPAARFNQLITSTILIVLDGHLLIVKGILRSYQAAPLSGLRIASVGTVLREGVGQLILAALEIAVPLLVALLLTELVLALAARAAPQLNVMVVGFALKSLVFALGFAVGVPLVINSGATLLDRALHWAVPLSGG